MAAPTHDDLTCLTLLESIDRELAIDGRDLEILIFEGLAGSREPSGAFLTPQGELRLRNLRSVLVNH
jgi:hypothetical protein